MVPDHDSVPKRNGYIFQTDTKSSWIRSQSVEKLVKFQVRLPDISEYYGLYREAFG